ncbi:MAG TPA: hypothetical protein VGU63_11740 [Candidatus Acidoferrales bacterium]|nr:hypothetical protein [Candidatus Acidoferrales bacterium]
MIAPLSARTKASVPLGRVYKNGARSNSKLLYVFIPGGITFSILPGFLLAIKYVGFPAKPDPPILTFIIWALLPAGLLLTAVGHRMSRGQWKGVSQQLHVALALAGLAFALTTVRYAIDGAHVRIYPAGVLLAISAVFLLSRLLMKFVGHERYPWENR